MTAPKKGMVAGQSITTASHEVSEQYADNHKATFGEWEKPKRSRWVWRNGEMVEVGKDWTDEERRAPVVTEELVYGNLRATDGTDISTRKRHREFKAEKGLADVSDYTNHIAKKQKERAEYFAGTGEDKPLHNQIGRLLYEAKKKGRR